MRNVLIEHLKFEDIIDATIVKCSLSRNNYCYPENVSSNSVPVILKDLKQIRKCSVG